MMRRNVLAIGSAALLFGATSAMGAVGLVDDFSGDLSNYTATVILDNNGGASNTASWQITGGTLEYVTSAYDGIEQSALIYNGLSLAVGEEVQVDLVHNGGNQDIGLYVGGTTPTTGVRQDYIAIYARGNGQVFSRGFQGTSEFDLAGGTSPAYETLFIARTDTNIYEAGYYEGGIRNIVTTRTPTTANEGDVVGFYTDVRAAGTLGNLDNLRIVPEPASMALMGLGGLLMLARRRHG